MASLSLRPQFETNLMSNRKVIELLLQLNSAKAHGKTYIKAKPHLVRHLLRNCLSQRHVDNPPLIVPHEKNDTQRAVSLKLILLTQH